MKRFTFFRCSRVWFVGFVLTATTLFGVADVQDTKGTELAQCRALSNVPDEVHNCMDNFLDEMDVQMLSYESTVIEQLGGLETESATAFMRSQESFKAFRRDNCLWYQAFSAPAVDADQIAKSCLIDVSRARFVELQELLEQAPQYEEFQGYYVYGDDRNSIVFCGSSDRYWVGSDATTLSQLQGLYDDKADADNVLLYVVVSGAIDNTPQVQIYPGHVGEFRLAKVIEARLPQENDCLRPLPSRSTNKLPTNSEEQALPLATVELPIDQPVPPQKESQTTSITNLTNIPSAEVASNEVLSADTPVPTNSLDSVAAPVADLVVRPDESLRAYFSAWTANCRQANSNALCVLSSTLVGQGLPEILQPVIKLTRRSGSRTVVDVEFPGQEIASISNILWKIDSVNLGALIGSRIRLDDTAATQELRQRGQIQGTILPQMIAGYELEITVLENSGQRVSYTATLIGLTRSLEFADSFISSADG